MKVLITKEDLLDLTTQIFIAAGVEQALATSWADVLVWANLRGTDSHGVMRVPRYLEWLDQGAINSQPDIHIATNAGALAVLEADKGPGGPAMLRAMDEAISRARAHNIGWCSARNITHAGAIGYYCLKAAEAGLAGIAMTASGQPLMAYHGASASGLSTNPLAIALPGGKRDPLLLDMSTSSVAYGKLLAAKSAAAEIPLGWGVDKDGRDTTNASEVETLLPLGGPKGSGLSLMIECLSSVAVGNSLIANTLAGSKNPGAFNGIAIAVNLASISDPNQFDDDMEQLAAELKNLPKADEVDDILLPGERGNAVMMTREKEGIPLVNATWQGLIESAERFDIAVAAYQVKEID